MRALLVATMMLLNVPALARCGDDEILENVEKMVREAYFADDNRPIEVHTPTTEDWSFFLGKYDCWAVLQFESRGLERVIHFEYIIRRSAEDWSKDVLTLMVIRDLED